MATGVYQNSTFGLAAILPMKYTNAIVLGNVGFKIFLFINIVEIQMYSNWIRLGLWCLTPLSTIFQLYFGS